MVHCPRRHSRTILPIQQVQEHLLQRPRSERPPLRCPLHIVLDRLPLAINKTITIPPRLLPHILP